MSHVYQLTDGPDGITLQPASPLRNRITIDPQILHGRACIRGHRIPVTLILDLLASGLTEADLLQEHPQLAPEDIRACLVYASGMIRQNEAKESQP